MISLFTSPDAVSSTSCHSYTPSRRNNLKSRFGVSFTPDDPKELRRHTQGKFRTDAPTLRAVAEAFIGDDQNSLEGAADAPLSEDLGQNFLQFKYHSFSPCPCEVHVEMQQVGEGPTHPLTPEGFVAWAERRVRDNPVFEGSTNTVELELAGALHQVMVERLQDFKSAELRDWLADILWVGHQGLTEKPSEELLREIEAEIIDLADDEFDTVEDAME